MSFLGLRTVTAKACVLVAVLIVVNIVACVAFMLNHYAKVLGPDRLQQDISAAEMFFNPDHKPYEIRNGQLYAGDRQISADNDVADQIGKVFASTAAIFQDDTRVATNVRRPDGTRALGTKLPPNIADIVLRKGQNYTGEVIAAGTPVIATYIPFKDAKGNIVGTLGMGFKIKEFKKAENDSMMAAATFSGVLILISIGLGLLAFRFLLSPFQTLSETMDDTKAGRYTEDVPCTERQDEFGALARVIQDFNRAMKDQARQREAAREAEIRAAEEQKRAEAEAQRRSEQLVVGTFGAGLKALAQNDLSYRLEGELPTVYKALQNDFNTAITAFEQNQREREEANRLQAETERKAAIAREEAMRTSEIKAMEMVVSSFGASMKQLAERDLTHQVDTDLPEGYRGLQSDFNTALTRLSGAMKEIGDRAAEIARNTKEVSQASQEMAHRTERQAATLEETAAAMEEVTANVSKSAENATEASRSAANAHSGAERGNVVAKSTIDAMRNIAHSSSEITQIISVIDEIAFQTNLLALNAGVEAARAGDAGKGFAVVASEVRSLAQRSAEAAKQIKALINTSEQQVETGVKLVEECGQALDSIVRDVANINILMSEIATAQKEQATALGEINVAISDLDHTTQQNAAMAEQSNAATRSMADHTGELAELIGHFKTAG